MANLVAIAFSDLHLYKWNAFNKKHSRLDWSLVALATISGVAGNYGVPLIFAGDWFHTPQAVENETMGRAIETYKRLIEKRKIDTYAISGNHDMCQKNGIDHRSPSHLDVFYEVFSTFHLMDKFHTPWPIRNKQEDVYIWGIPYMNSDLDLKARIEVLRKEAKKIKGLFKILVLHGDCPGAVEGSGMELSENKALGKKEGLDEFFKEWDLVLFGHIHVPQKLSKKCHMLGSPIHQTSGDNCEMGYWKIFSDRKPQFVGLVDFPKFIKLKKGEIAPDEHNYYIPFEEIGAIEEVEKGDFDLSNTRKKLAKRYMKAKGIKNKNKRNALIKALNEVE